jgi:Mg2+ and Co2+ transporter CorA
MPESKLRDEMDQSALVRQKNPTLSNLLYNQQGLDRHVQRVRDNLASIRSRNTSSWPQGWLEEEKQREADIAADKLLQDYEYLLSRGLALSKQSVRGMGVIMNNAVINTSQKAIAQAEGVARLTRLAFFFIPLSFSTSFFAMSFAQFGQATLSIWNRFVVSLLVVALSLVMMKYDAASVLRRVRRYGIGKKRHGLWAQDRHDFPQHAMV